MSILRSLLSLFKRRKKVIKIDKCPRCGSTHLQYNSYIKNWSYVCKGWEIPRYEYIFLCLDCNHSDLQYNLIREEVKIDKWK